MKDVSIPLAPPKLCTVDIPHAGSSSQDALEILGRNVNVITAFQNISQEYNLHKIPLYCDFLVCGMSKNTLNEMRMLVNVIGLTGWDAGSTENSVVVEGLT